LVALFIANGVPATGDKLRLSGADDGISPNRLAGTRAGPGGLGAAPGAFLADSLGANGILAGKLVLTCFRDFH
jgi:hypothetical protein